MKTEPSYEASLKRMSQLVQALKMKPLDSKRQSRIADLGEMWERRNKWKGLANPPAPLVEPTREAVQAVGSFSNDPKPEVRLAVMVALKAALPHRDVACEALSMGLSDEDIPTRVQAATSLWHLSPVPAAVEPLRRCLEDSVRAVRFVAARALARTSPTPGVVPVLLEAVETDPNGSFFLMEFRFLGAHAESALQRLRDLRAAWTGRLREELDQTIRFIEESKHTDGH